MENIKFTEENLKTLLEIPSNAYLKKTEEEKYADFSRIDPFPDIPNALLNSIDITKYVLTTGMMRPFCAKNLSGAIYTCNFSGRYYYWDDKKILCTKLLTDDHLVLLPNSITFLEIEQFFRIPFYIALRFNLQVPHVYKGLLLGTGPIIDPSFVGNLYIPLHNLTSNKYIIKKDAPLINVEFTKLSHSSECNIVKGSKQEKIIQRLAFDNVSYTLINIKSNRLFMEYTEKALREDDLFFKEDKDKIYINSSIPETIKTLKKVDDKINYYNEKFKEIDTDLKNTKNNLKKKVNKSINKLSTNERFVRTFSIIAIIGLMLTAIVLFIGARSYFDGAKKISEVEQKINILEAHIQALENDKIKEGETP